MEDDFTIDDSSSGYNQDPGEKQKIIKQCGIFNVCAFINLIKSIIIITEVVIMKNQFIKSLQMIKILGIKNPTEYENLSRDFLVLSLDSLKYISQTENFDEIVKMAKEIIQIIYIVKLKNSISNMN